MASGASWNVERRRHRRAQIRLPVQFHGRAGTRRLGAGITVDLSPGGLLAECPHIPDVSPDYPVTVRVGMPSEPWEEPDGCFQGRVRRVEGATPYRCAVEVVGVGPAFLLFPELIGKHPSILEVKKKLVDIADCSANVLIRGQTGTGKNVVARLIHQYSSRANSPFVRQNCAAIPETLMESQLFGHEKGAFTDAKSPRPGVFRLAHKGTVVLDEISAVPCALQAKLLQAIEDRKFFSLGGTREVEVDVRIIATTNDDLEGMMMRGTFRSDLFYRLNELSLTLPALRDRKSDVPLLADFFLRKYCSDFGKAYQPFGRSAMEMFLPYSWPGNVRELENTVKRRVLTGQLELPAIDAGESSDAGQPKVSAEAPARAPEELGRLVASAERVAILRAIVTAGYNKTRAAAALGISYRTLLRKIKRYEIRF